jgi:hypothetical protein
LNAHSNYSSISDPSALNNTVGFCIDAGDRAISFNKRNRCYKAATGLTMASAKGFDFICFRQIVRRFLADCRNKYRRETSGVATLNLPLPTPLTAEYWQAMQQW